MRIYYVDNNGGGFADHIEVREGSTVDELFKERMPGKEAADYMIRVNRQPVSRDYILGEGDRVTITPLKIQGAV